MSKVDKMVDDFVKQLKTGSNIEIDHSQPLTLEQIHTSFEYFKKHFVDMDPVYSAVQKPWPEFNRDEMKEYFTRQKEIFARSYAKPSEQNHDHQAVFPYKHVLSKWFDGERIGRYKFFPAYAAPENQFMNELVWRHFLFYGLQLKNKKQRCLSIFPFLTDICNIITI